MDLMFPISYIAFIDQVSSRMKRVGRGNQKVKKRLIPSNIKAKKYENLPTVFLSLHQCILQIVCVFLFMTYSYDVFI